MGHGTLGGMGKQGGSPGDRNKSGDSRSADRNQRRKKGPEAAAHLPSIAPLSMYCVRLLKIDRVKDYLLLEEEFVAVQEWLRHTKEKTKLGQSKVDDLCDIPMSVGSLEKIIDEEPRHRILLRQPQASCWHTLLRRQ